MKKSLFVELLELLELEMGSGNWEYVLLSRRKFYTGADFPPGGGGRFISSCRANNMPGPFLLEESPIRFRLLGKEFIGDICATTLVLTAFEKC